MSENILAQFLRSEKDLRPYWETDHRGMVLPLIKSGYNNSVSYGLPGILGGSAPSVLNDILQGRMVDKGEIEQGATDAAGAAMTGSLALSRPSGSIGSGGRPETPSIRAYRGVDTGAPKSIGNRTSMFASSNPEVADAYANAFGGYDRGAVMPVEMNFSNPFVVNAKGAHWTEIPHNGDIISTEELAALARRSGHDGMIVNNVIDTNSKSQTQVPSTTYAGLRPGTVRNAITGDLLYANAPTSAAAPSVQHIAQAAAREQAPGIRAYHGSPHDFDKFDISKIGSGEGAQAYGHGIYLAENEGVAQSYKGAGDAGALQREAINQKLRNIAREMDRDPIGSSNSELRAKYDAALAERDKLGRMYEVNIKADPNDFLDWDKPLSQQSEKVRGDLAKLGIRDEIGEKKTPPSITGWEYADSNIYLGDSVANDQGTALLRRIGGDHAGHPEVSQKLRDAGIPGIKYLDQGSRVNGEGSRNYVVFSDKDIEIIRKYGLAAFLAMGGAAASQPPTNDGPRNVLAGPF